jgi:hypothetical protein
MSMHGRLEDQDAPPRERDEVGAYLGRTGETPWEPR